ncbi:MAG TPA: ABC transporter permease [Bryobacteraceae bacterium]|nr:ABC transporter permease [Bryobacteraceae bacterium]
MINKLVIENLKHRPIRTLLTVIAIGLQVTLVLTIVGLSRGLIESSTARNRGVGADVIVRPPASSVIGLSSAPMQEAVVNFVEKQPHVVLAQGVVIHSVGGVFESIVGIDLDRFTRMSGGLDFRDGGPFRTPNDILIDTAYASQRKLKVGDTVKLANHNWTVRGVVGQGKLGKLFVDKKVLQDLTANTGKVSMVYAKVDDPANVAAVVTALKGKLEGYPIFEMEEFLSFFSNPDNIPGLSPFIVVLVGIAVVFGFLVVFLAMYTAVLERTREIGILKALGATAPFILGMLLRETVMLAIVGSMIGIALAWVARQVIITVVPSSLPVVMVPDWWWRAGLISLAGCVLGALYPGLKAARQDTIEALTYE